MSSLDRRVLALTLSLPLPLLACGGGHGKAPEVPVAGGFEASEPAAAEPEAPPSDDSAPAPDPGPDLYPLGPRGGASLYVADDRIGPITAGTVLDGDELSGTLPSRYHVIDDKDSYPGSFRIEVGYGSQDSLAMLLPSSRTPLSIGMVWLTSNRMRVPGKPWVVDEAFDDVAGLDDCTCIRTRPTCFEEGTHFGVTFDARCGGSDPDGYLGKDIEALAWSPTGFPLDDNETLEAPVVDDSGEIGDDE